jgi:hypothetical protein
MTNPNYTSSGSKYGSAPKIIAVVVAAAFAVTCAFGAPFFEGHSQFLFGLGNLPEDTVLSLPFGKYFSELYLLYTMYHLISHIFICCNV